MSGSVGGANFFLNFLRVASGDGRFYGIRDAWNEEVGARRALVVAASRSSRVVARVAIDFPIGDVSRRVSEVASCATTTRIRFVVASCDDARACSDSVCFRSLSAEFGLRSGHQSKQMNKAGMCVCDVIRALALLRFAQMIYKYNALDAADLHS